MNNAFGMSGIERIGDINGNLDNSLGIQGTRGYQIFQGHAIQILHRDEGMAFVASDFVDGADIRVIERRCALCFAAKTFQGIRFPDSTFGQELQSDKPAELFVLGFVDYAHAATPQFLQHTVTRDRLPGSGVGLSHLSTPNASRNVRLRDFSRTTSAPELCIRHGQQSG